MIEQLEHVPTDRGRGCDERASDHGGGGTPRVDGRPSIVEAQRRGRQK
jgi:hypothetical protein